MTFEEWWEKESGWDDGGPLLAEGHLARAAWEAALKSKTDDGALLPCSGGLEGHAPTKKQIDSACLSFRHDFGLMEPSEMESVRFRAKEWLYAWQKEFGLR